MQVPGPSAREFRRGERNGFLDYAGELWRKFGDLFQVRIGSRTLVCLFHPDAVEHITVADAASPTRAQERTRAP